MEKTPCFHCGTDCDSGTIVFDDKPFCCNGCKTVYEIFSESDLTCYYDMQNAPGYDDIITDIAGFLTQRVKACNDAGIANDRILLDPGFGFGKTLEHNLELLSRLDELQALKLPLLIGVSRKRMIGTITGRSEKDRIPGSIAAAVIGVMNGARLVRTHDVAETVDAIKICNEVLKAV